MGTIEDVGKERLRDCAEDSVESPQDVRCGRMASTRVEPGFAACEAEENLLLELKTEVEVPEKLEPEAGEGFDELLVLHRLQAGG